MKTLIEPSSLKIKQEFKAILLILDLLGLTAILFLSIYTRFHADDFCMAGTVNSMPFFKYFGYWYIGWTGRYSFIFFTGLSGLLGVKFASVLPTIMVSIWLLLNAWAILPIVRQKKCQAPVLSAFASSGIFLFILLLSLPNIFQSVFWNNGAINYSFPLITFTINIGIIIRLWYKNIKGRGWVLLNIFLTLMTGGFSEIFILMQITFFVLVMLYLYFFVECNNYKHIWYFLVINLISAFIALLIVAIAPGNQVRQSLLDEPTNLLILPIMVLRNTLIIFYIFLKNSGFWMILLITIPFLLSLIWTQNSVEMEMIGKSYSLRQFWNQKWFKGSILVGLFVFLMTMSAATPSSYIQGDYPENRAMILPFYFIVIGIMTIMYLLGAAVRKLPKVNQYFQDLKIKVLIRVLILILFGTGLTLTVLNTFHSLPDYVGYAQLWDLRDQELRTLKENNVKEVTIFKLESYFGLEDIHTDPKYWVNRYVAEYYGFDTITGQ